MDRQTTDALAASTRELPKFSLGDLTLEQALLRVAQLAEGTAGADMVGLTLLSEGEPRTSVFTDAEAVEVDEAQYRSGRGPCLEAYRTKQVIRTEDTTIDDRWPEFAAMAEAHGIHSSLSLPLILRDDGIGALNIYSRRRAAFSEQIEAPMQLFGELSAVLVANVEAYWGARNAADQMQEAMRSRATIEQAKGILVAGGAADAEAAFQMLVSASQRENRKLREIAAAIVQRACSDSGDRIHREESSNAE